jgi:ABC-type multidrug transport system ATPase subunit
LQILRGQLICDPPTARSHPYLLEETGDLSRRLPERAIEYVGFDVESKAFGGAYLSARYESYVEETDFSVERYLRGQTSLNPEEDWMREHMPDQETWDRVIKDLELEPLFGKPVSVLSNGQTRRAKIGKALLKRPKMLCLDAAFSELLRTPLFLLL